MFEALDERDRRFLLPMRSRNVCKYFRLSFSLDEYALGIVDDPACQTHLFREAKDERAKADALHGSADGDRTR